MTRTLSSRLRFNLNDPSSPVVVPRWVPLTKMVTPARPSLASSAVTRPVIGVRGFLCAAFLGAGLLRAGDTGYFYKK